MHDRSRFHRRSRHGHHEALYDATLKPLGYQGLSEGDGSLGYGRDVVAFWIGVAEHPVPEDSGSGLHFCLSAPTRDSVDAFHAAALAAGGRDNGQPGLRPDYGANSYAAFVVDPDGYRIEAYCGAAMPWLRRQAQGVPHIPPRTLCERSAADAPFNGPEAGGSLNSGFWHDAESAGLPPRGARADPGLSSLDDRR